MTFPSHCPKHSSWLEENFGEEMLNFIYSNITRADILNQIQYYNSDRPQAEHIFILPTQEDIELTGSWGMKWKGENEADRSDNEALSELNKAVDDIREAPADPAFKFSVSSRPGEPDGELRGDNVPLWLEISGFEQRTTDWLAQQASELARKLRVSEEEEERRQEELATLKGTAMENSKRRLLELLCNYADEIQLGKLQFNEELRLLLKSMIVHAKGKCQKISEDEPVEFTSLLEHQNNLLKSLLTREDIILYWWWCYSKHCAAMDSEIDDNVVSAVNTLIALTKDMTEKGTTPEKGLEEEVRVDEVGKKSPDEVVVKEGDHAKKPDLTGYEALKQIISEQDKRYPKYLEEILQEACTRSGVGIETILAQANETQKLRGEAEPEPVRTL